MCNSQISTLYVKSSDMKLYCIIFCVITKNVYCDLVEEYVNSINDLIKEFVNYVPDLDSRKYLNGASPRSNPLDLWGEYDFIIVGTGTAGSAIAGRLSEIKEFKVLALEAGMEGNDITDIPGMDPLLQNSQYNWGYRSTEQRTCCLGMAEKKCPYWRGRAVGGSTVTNAMVYTRGNKLDYDAWAELGNPEWSYEEMLPYFLKSENACLPDADANFHSREGPLHVRYVKYLHPLGNAFLHAAQQMGSRIGDYNGIEQFSFSRIQTTQFCNRRWGADKAFLNPEKPNLEVLQQALVLKVIIKDERALGVEFIHKGKFYTAKASKEVIVSAGVFNSPHLLMLSGIGPRDHLEELEIDVIKDLSVGKNLADHLFNFALLFSTNFTQEDDSVECLVSQYLSGEGFYTAALNLQALGFIQTNVTELKVPDAEILFFSTENNNGAFYKYALNFTRENVEAIWTAKSGHISYVPVILQLHTKSRGRVYLKSKDPFDYPLIDLNYFSDAGNIDLDIQLAAIKYVISLSETPAFQKFNARLDVKQLPDCANHEFLSDDYWRCAIPILNSAGLHASGTCRMGPGDDKEAVVDHELRVYGIEGLRVADASIVPITLSAHMMAPVYAVGEKAADLIKRTYGYL